MTPAVLTADREKNMATTQLCPYVQFQGNAREAVTFYQSVMGGELTISTFADIPMEGTPDEIKDKVMHAHLENDLLTFMASDTPPGMAYSPAGNVTLALFGNDASRLKELFAGLSEGGQVTVPLDKQPWGDEHGSFSDKFGVNWMVNIGAE